MGADDLVERDTELALLDALMTGVVEQREGAVAVIEGLPGVGKSALLGAATERARARGTTVLAARGAELESELAFGAVRQLLAEPVLRLGCEEREQVLSGPAALARSVLGLGSHDLGSGLADPLYGLYWLVANLAERGPLVVTVDDLHWLDEESGRFVAYLARRIEGLPVLLLTAARPDKPGATGTSPVAALAGLGTVLRPQPLTPSAVAEVVTRAVLAIHTPTLAAEVHRVTGGNPFLVSEVARSLAIAASAPMVGAIEQLAPTTVARSVLDRVGRVSDDAVTLAHAVALFPAGATLADAAAVAVLEPRAAAPAADGLVATGVFAAGERLAFLHPIMRAAVYDDMGEFARRHGHARAAAVLRARGAAAEEIAAHLLAGEPAGSADSVDDLCQAARAAVASGALRAGARYLERAVCEPPPRDQRLQLLSWLGRIQAMTGAPSAERTLRAALAEATTPEQQANAAIELAAVRYGHLDADGAVEALLPVRSAASVLDRERRLLVDGVLAVAAWDSSRHASRYIEIADALPADLAGATPGERLALVTVGARMFDRCEDHERVLRVLLRAVGDEPAPLAVCGIDLGDPLSILIACGALDESAELCRARQDQARAAGRDALFVAAQAGLSRIALLRGDVREAEGMARLGLDLPGAHPTDRVVLAGHLASVLIATDRLDEADAVLDAVESMDANSMPGWMTRRRRAEIAIGRGCHEAALPVLAEAYDALLHRQSTNPSECLWATRLADALAAVGRGDEAFELVSALLGRAEAFAEPRPVGVLHVALGRLVGGSAAVEHFEEAVHVLGPSPYRLDFARAQLHLGAALRRANRRVAARPPLRDALDFARRNAIEPLAVQAEEELRATGGRPRRLVLSGVEALTPSELRIARLAVEGLTNRELAQHLFLTIKTVEMHLGRAYRKLGVASRRELAGALDDRVAEVSDPVRRV